MVVRGLRGFKKNGRPISKWVAWEIRKYLDLDKEFVEFLVKVLRFDSPENI